MSEYEVTEDDLDFARETLGPDATDSEIATLAAERAARDSRERRSDETYNGWANHETWAFWLHVTNDQGWYESVRDVAQDVIRVSTDDVTDYHIGSQIVEYVKDTLDDIRQQHNEGDLDMMGSVNQANMMRDEIGSWWRIDYTEIGAAARELASDQ